MPGRIRPPSHTPLAALGAIVLDLETTGLDVVNDRVVQIGAVAMHGAAILDTPRLDALVDPGTPIPPASTHIHGLTDADVAGAPPFADEAADLHEMLSGRVVIGHNIAFDLAVLRYEAARNGIEWHDPPAIDVRLVAGALEPNQPDLGLDALAHALDVTIDGRHTALGDAVATARVYAALLPRLVEADVRTLGEVQTLAERRSDLVLRQAEAGWHTTPRGSRTTRPSAPPLRVDSYIFSRRLDQVMSPTPVMVGAQTTLREAARIMVERRIGALLIGQPGTAPAGILTEHDLLRTTSDASIDPDATRVSEVMNAPVQSIAGAEILYRALGRMDRLGIRHLCVTDPDGTAIGMVSQRDLLHHRARSAVILVDALAEADDVAALAQAYAHLADVANGLVAEGLGGVEVARIVSKEVQALTGRATGITIARMRDAGRGDPPARWCMMVLGSAGRGESLLNADQDNALVHAGADDDDAWFAELGAGVADMLDHAGIPRCKRGVMAANAGWRGSQDGWRERIGAWLGRAQPDDLLNVDIFFDLIPVAGDRALARALHRSAVDAASRSPRFLGLLAESVADKSPPLGLLRRIRTDGDGRADLKLGGLLPMVSLARALALRVGSIARATPERLRAAATADRLAEGDATSLIAVHAELMTLVLRQQLIDLETGIRPTARVEIKTLDRASRGRLRGDLRSLEDTLRVIRGTMN